MNIGIFSDTYYPQINGVSTSIRMLDKELSKRGHKVFIFTTTDPKAPSSSARVFRLPSMPFVFLPTHRMCLLYPPKLLVHLKGFKLDIIHTQTEFPVGIFGKIVSEFYQIPLVHTYHTMYEDYVHYIARGHLITPKMAQQFSRVFCNRAREVIAPVEKTKESLLEYGVIRPIHVIPTGIDFEPFRREKYTQEEINEIKKGLGIDLGDPIVIFVGRVAQEKSIDVIMRQFPAVLKKIPTAKFVIVGDGPVREGLREMARTQGIEKSVVFAGAQPWDNIGKYYQLGDVFVTASTSETQGLTYIEAMSARVPVVAKKDRSTEGVISHGNTGYYFEKDNELGDLLLQILANPSQSQQIVEAAYKSIEALSSRQFAQNVEALYTDTIADFHENKKAKKKNITLITRRFRKKPQ